MTVKPRKRQELTYYLSDKGIQGYRCESGIAIYAYKVTLNHANRLNSPLDKSVTTQLYCIPGKLIYRQGCFKFVKCLFLIIIT